MPEETTGEGSYDVLVLGAGAIGVCSAYALARSGRRVAVLERSEVCSGASYGNAGWVFPGHGAPLAGPGAISKSARWLFDPESPLRIKARLDYGFLRWLYEFWRACDADRARRTFALNRELALRSLELTADWVAEEKLGCHFQRKGVIVVCESEAGLREAEADLSTLRSLGGDAELLSSGALGERVPSLASGLAGGVCFPDDGHLRPDAYVQELAAAAERRGVEFFPKTEVLDLERRGARISRVIANRGEFEADQIVVAAGAWSNTLNRRIGFRVPLEAAKGYSITVESPERGPDVPLLLKESKVAVTPIGNWLRFAGTLELAGLNLDVSLRRVDSIWRAARRHLPDVAGRRRVETWRGLRPCSPDDLPYIGRIPGCDNLLLATGHGMAGISQSAVTGRLVSQLIEGSEPDLDVGPLDPGRFSGR